MRSSSVAILGGGPGGLMTAYQLQKRAVTPFSTTIFEASGRLGGKIVTRRFDGAPVPYEAGAAELYDYSQVGHDPLRELIAELGLSTSPMSGASVVLNNRILANTDDIRDEFGTSAWNALERFDQLARDWMSPKEFYAADWIEGNGALRSRQSFEAVLSEIKHEAARRYVRTMVHSDLATEPSQTNGTYGLQNYLMNHPAYMRLYSIDGGIERLPQELANRVEARVHFGQRVLRVEKGAGERMRVVSERNGETFRSEFDFVVAALPNNLLPTIEWGGPILAAAMRKHHAHYDYPAHYLRVSILFDRPFWRERINESFFMLDAFGGCCLYDESSRSFSGSHGVLGWLLGGQPACDLSTHEDDALIDMMLDSLPSFLSRGRTHFVEGRVHRWMAAVNGMPAGYPTRDPDSRHQPEPTEHPNLFLVGDYLFDSTLNGVLDSADYVAEWLAVELEERSRDD